MKDIDKGIIYKLPQVNKYVHALQQPAHLMTTQKTFRACPPCRGTRKIAVRSKTRDTATIKYCFNCMGTGEVFE